ncbi:hypothetical protein EMPS_09643 [Entomortierella parvispora]|uniref:Uncharacterized protein n=1 Tax=Entomortierella parvispora TaxID=205924 RepID=A0A9P3HIC6_9FUNG|nr:hypothetical protein EMPS_09643 [Entomortierella parvispora]
MDHFTTLYQSIQRDIDAFDQDRRALDNSLVAIQDRMDKKDANSGTLKSSSPELSQTPPSTKSFLSQAFPAQHRSPPATPTFSLSSPAISPFTTKEKSSDSQAQTPTKDDSPSHDHPLLETLWTLSGNSWSVYRSLVLQDRSNLQSRRDQLIERQGTLLQAMVDLSTRLAELSKDERVRGLELAKEERLREREIEMQFRLRELQKEEKIRLREIKKEEKVRLHALKANTTINSNTESSVNSSSSITSSVGSNNSSSVRSMGSSHESKSGESSSKAGPPLANAETIALGEQSGPKPAWLVAMEAKEAAAAAAAGASSGTGSGMGSSGEVRPTDSIAISDGERPPRSYLAKGYVASSEGAATIAVAAPDSPDTASNTRSSKKSREGVRAGYASRVDAIINNIR